MCFFAIWAWKKSVLCWSLDQSFINILLNKLIKCTLTTHFSPTQIPFHFRFPIPWSKSSKIMKSSSDRIVNWLKKCLNFKRNSKKHRASISKWSKSFTQCRNQFKSSKSVNTSEKPMSPRPISDVKSIIVGEFTHQRPLW